LRRSVYNATATSATSTTGRTASFGSQATVRAPSQAPTSVQAKAGPSTCHSTFTCRR
jgi:hypothetical protein